MAGRQHKSPGSSTDWELLERLYFEGLPRDSRGREEILAPYRSDYPSLVAELEALWDHQPHTGSLFPTLAQVSRSFWQGFAGEQPPARFGSYQVLEELDRGGMGVVYKALQPAPLSRHVAIKVLPTALFSASWRKRFEIEQKTLSVMSHPHIATVHDAGVTPEGQPFLVMEYLEGPPITHYCDAHRLSIEARLALFTRVCEGVNHAHRKGVIHRDLKPGNVLVVEQDGRYLPKIIDFGIAHTADRPQAEQSALALGTPAYMSPEQAAGQQDQIDTQSDIYSLGALLFELLVGKPPLHSRLRTTIGFRERCQVVSRHVPQSLAQQAPHLATEAVAAARATTPAVLVRRLKGELDWITGKALARNPENRYGSCSEWIEDLRRFSQNRPVAAAPERTWYPFKKWLANHKLLVAGGFALVSALVFALIVSRVSLRAVRASESHLRQVHAFSESIFREVGPYYEGRDLKVIDLLDDAAEGIGEKYADQPDLEASIRLVLAQSYGDLGFYDKAETHYARAHAIALSGGRPDDPQSLDVAEKRAFNLFYAGREAQAEALYKDALAASVQRHGANHPLSLKLSNGYAFVLGRRGKVARAGELFPSTLQAQRNLLGPTHPETLATINNYGDWLLTAKKFAEAETLFREVLAAYEAKTERADPYRAILMHNLALAFLKQNRHSEAIELGREVWALRKRLLGQHHRETLSTVSNLATAIGNLDPGQAVGMLREALEGLPERAKGSPEDLNLRHNLGHFLMVTKDLDDAEELLRETWRQRVEMLGPSHLDTLKTHVTLGEVAEAAGRREEALSIYREVVKLSEQAHGPEHPQHQTFLRLLQDAAPAKEVF